MSAPADSARPLRRRLPLTGGIAKNARQATVTAAEHITPTTRRIRLVADEPIELPFVPGQHVRVQINDPLSLYGMLRPTETLRTYTIWEHDPAERALELRTHLYDGDGIGLRWATTVRPGDRVVFWWPRSTFHTRDAGFHLFAGEETAAAAFGPMLRALDATERVHGVLESAGPEHDLPIPGPHSLRRVHRGGTSAASSRTLVDAVAALDLPDGDGAAYVAGEARTCQMVRDHLVRDRGWDRRAVLVKPFWAPGKRGLH